MKKSIWIFILLSAIIITAFISSSSANNTKVYELYKNDTKFSLPEYPAISIDSEIYVPTSFFIGLDNIRYEYNKNYQSFYFMNTDTLRYFSFSFNAKDIIVDGVYTKKTFPVVNSTIYLPIAFCAEVLSLNIEIIENQNTVSIRLTDGSETVEFEELIKLLNPTDPTPPDIENPDNPIDNPQIDTPVQTNREKVFLMFRFENAGLCKPTLDALSSFGERATVFFDNEQMLKLPEEVIHALVGGNGIGIIPTTISNATNTNNTLKLLTNTKTSAALGESNQEADEQGLVFLKPDIDSENYTNLDSWSAAQAIYNDALNLEQPHVLITVRENSENLILALLGFFSNNDRVELATIAQ